MSIALFAMAAALQAAVPTAPAQAAAPAPTVVLPGVVVVGNADAQTPTSADPGDRMICRREPVLGSNRRERICVSARERDARRAQSREMMDETRQGSLRAPSPVTGGNISSGRGF